MWLITTTRMDRRRSMEKRRIDIVSCIHTRTRTCMIAECGVDGRTSGYPRLALAKCLSLPLHASIHLIQLFLRAPWHPGARDRHLTSHCIEEPPTAIARAAPPSARVNARTHFFNSITAVEVVLVMSGTEVSPFVSSFPWIPLFRQPYRPRRSGCESFDALAREIGSTRGSCHSVAVEGAAPAAHPMVGHTSGAWTNPCTYV